MVNDVFELYKVEEIKESSYKNYPNYKFPMIFRYLSDHVHCMYAALIFILTSVFTFRETIISLFKTLFFKNGNFQWIAFTALVGFGTLVYNVHSTHKNNYYNTISKARLEWLKEHRNNMAKLILDCEVCLFKLEELVSCIYDISIII